jgi:TP901 family phage tail tape measure protein
MPIEAARLAVVVEADTDPAERQMGGFSSSMRGHIGRISDLFIGFLSADIFHQMVSGAIGAVNDLQDAFTPIGTLLGTQSQQFEDLTGSLRDFIAHSPQSADDIGKAAYDALSSGISGTTEVMDAVRASADLAAAGLGGMKPATDLVTSAMNSFRSEGLTAEQAARTLFGTISVGKTTTDQLAQGFGQIAPLAAQTGIRFQDLMAATAALTGTGQTASVAYTGLRATIQNIINPTGEASRAANRLGLELSATHLANVGLPAFLQEVQAATHGNVDQMTNMFTSTQALNTVMALTGPQAQTMATDLGAITEAGSHLSERAREVNSTMSNEFATMRNRVTVALAETGSRFMETFGPVLLGAINGAISALNRIIDVAAFLGDHVEILIGIGAGLVIGLGAWAVSMIAAAIATGTFDGAMAALGLTTLVAAAPFIALGVAIAALVAGVIYAYQHFETFRDIVDTTWQVIQQVTTTAVAVVQAVITGFIDVVTAVWQVFGDDIVRYFQIAWDLISGVISAAVQIIQGILDVFIGVFTGDWSRAWDGVQEIVAGAWTAIQTLIQFALDYVLLILNTAWDAIRAGVQLAWAAVLGVLQAAWDAIQGVVSAAVAVVEGVINAHLAVVSAVFRVTWDAVLAVFNAVWGMMSTIVQVHVGVITTVVSTAWEAIRAVTSTVWEAIRAVVDTAINAARTVVETAVNAMRSVAETAFNGMVTAARVFRDGVTGVVADVRTVLGWVATAIRDLWSVATDIWNRIVGVFNAARDGISRAVQAVRDAVSNALGPLGRFVDLAGSVIGAAGSAAGAVGGAASAVGGALTSPFRAAGGPVTGGRSYIVGEVGPELFVPGTSGRIIPNSDLRYRGGAGGGDTYNFTLAVEQFAGTRDDADHFADIVAASLARFGIGRQLAVDVRTLR